MKPEPVLHQAPPLAEALGQVLAAAPEGPLGLMGRPGLSAKLEQAGRVVEVLEESWLPGQAGRTRFAALVLVGQIKRLSSDRMRETLLSWADCLKPGGLLVTAEMGAEGRVGNWLLGLGRRLRGRGAMPPWVLTSLLLDLGVAPVHQRWPQGVGAWVLTWGPIHRLALHKQAVSYQEERS